MFNSALTTLSAQANKYANQASVMATKYGKEVHKKVNAAMGKEQIVQIGNRQMRVLELLAEGGYAYVYKAEDVLTGQVLALKRMLIQDEENVGLADKEIDIMKRLAGKPFVIQFLGSTKRAIEHPRATEYFVLMELCTGGSLMDMITRRNKRKLDEGEMASIFYQIVVSVSHLHKFKPPVAHRDLKIENILIGENGEMRLCDFGSCTDRAQAYLTRDEMTEEEERIQRYSTSMYRAPEMVDLYKKEVINEKVDIWALGCILYTLAFYTQPFQDGGNLQIIGGNYNIPEDHKYSKTAITIIKKTLTVTPKKRPDIKKLLIMIDKWIKELRKNGMEVNIPKTKEEENLKQKKKGKKKSKSVGDSQDEASDEESDEETDDADDDEEEEDTGGRKSPSKSTSTKGSSHNGSAIKQHPPSTNTKFDEDFAADFDAHSPRSPPVATITTSQSFGSFQGAATANNAQSSAASNTLSPPVSAKSPPPTSPRSGKSFNFPAPPKEHASHTRGHANSVGTSSASLTLPTAKSPAPTGAPPGMFDMSAFADSLVTPKSPQPQQQPQHQNTGGNSNLHQHPHPHIAAPPASARSSPPPGPGSSASGSRTPTAASGSFNFFEGAAAKSPSAKSPTPLPASSGLKKSPSSTSPRSPTNRAAATGSTASSNGLTKKPTGDKSPAAAAKKKKGESSSEESSSESDSDDSDDSDESDSDDDKKKKKKKSTKAATPTKKGAAKK